MKKFSKHRISDKSWQQLVELKNVILILLIFIDFLFILIITFFNVSYTGLYLMSCFDLMVCVMIFLDLCYEYTQYTKGIKSFLREHLIDFISIIPFNFIFLRYLAIFRIARLLQFFQIFKIFAMGRRNRGSIKYFIQNGLLKFMLVIAFLYVLFSSIALVVVEPSIETLFEAFWFNLVTITSVGYGDLVPITQPGKIIAMFTIVIGIMFVSIFTAAMSGIYMEKPEMETRKAFRTEVHNHISKLEEDNKLLHEEISDLKIENKKLNDKLDKVIDLLEKR